MADLLANLAMDSRTSSQVLRPSARSGHATLHAHLSNDISPWLAASVDRRAGLSERVVRIIPWLGFRRGLMLEASQKRSFVAVHPTLLILQHLCDGDLEDSWVDNTSTRRQVLCHDVGLLDHAVKELADTIKRYSFLGFLQHRVAVITLVFSNVKNGRLLTDIGAPINKLFLIIHFSITFIDLLIPNPVRRIQSTVSRLLLRMCTP
jgi:hypothetical protein